MAYSFGSLTEHAIFSEIYYQQIIVFNLTNKHIVCKIVKP
jgi:hypothetical protein